MKFGPIPTGTATGAILAHSMEAIDETQKTYRIRKGSRLTTRDTDALQRTGHTEIIAAVLEDGDIHEDAAAARLATALVPDSNAANLRLSQAATGRVNIFATSAGVAQIDVETIAAFNAVDPMITVATVPSHHRMVADGMVATIKVISYAVAEQSVQAAEACGPALTLALPVHQTATLIETTFAGDKALSDKGRRAMAMRLQRFGLTLTRRVIVPHTTSAISNAIQDAPGDVVMILTASATSDPRDVGPEAVRAAGGTVTRFGMPVDPGNLLFLGEAGGKPVIGLPGCARSPVINGADWILERTICGISISDADIAGMGVGGLLKESPARMHPRHKAT